MTKQLFLFLLTIFFCTSCVPYEHIYDRLNLSAPKTTSNLKSRILDLNKQKDINELVGSLTEKRALFIGEIHDRLDHHQNQLKLIQHLYELYPYIAIGVEFFQQPFQAYVDAYIAGEIDEREMLIKTEYFKRWKIDYRMLQPILRFARDKHIPVLALNISEEIHHKVFEGGFKSLSDVERSHIPEDIEPISDDYRNRLKVIFDSHPEGASFETFIEGQQLWDESMADTAATYLEQHPQRLLVVLSGLGHVIYADGIPRNLNRRLGGRYSSVAINGSQFGEFPGIADFILTTPGNEQLPDAGLLGISVTDSTEGAFVTKLLSDSAAKAAGINIQDRIVSLDGMKIANFFEIKSIMFDKRPGDIVRVEVLRGHLEFKKEMLQFEITLR